VTDEIDLSQERTLIATEAAIANQLARQKAAESRQPARPADVNDDELQCIECGEPVGAERLKALPRTRRCIECASDAEHPNWTRRA
jgi:RNA polymerase-binding transcription factor DksA